MWDKEAAMVTQQEFTFKQVRLCRCDVALPAVFLIKKLFGTSFNWFEEKTNFSLWGFFQPESKEMSLTSIPEDPTRNSCHHAVQALKARG